MFGAVPVHQLLQPYIFRYWLEFFLLMYVLSSLGSSTWEVLFMVEVVTTGLFEAGVCFGWNPSMAEFRHCGGVGSVSCSGLHVVVCLLVVFWRGDLSDAGRSLLLLVLCFPAC